MDNNGMFYDDGKAREDFSQSTDQSVRPEYGQQDTFTQPTQPQQFDQQVQPEQYQQPVEQNQYAPQDVYDQSAQQVQPEYTQQNAYEQPADQAQPEQYEQSVQQNQYVPQDQYVQPNPYAQQDQYAQQAASQNQYSTYDPQSGYSPYGAQGGQQNGYGPYGPQDGGQQNGYGPYGPQDGGQQNGYGPYDPQNGGQQNGYGPYGPQNGGQQNGYGPYGPQNGGQQNTYGGSQDIYGANASFNQPGGPGNMKKGLSKKGKTILFSILGAVLLVGLALFLIFGVFYTPKKRLKKAMEANKQTDYCYFNTPFDEVLGTGDIIKTFEEKGGSAEIRVGFNDIDGSTRFEGIGFGGKVNIDRNAKKLSCDFTIDDEEKIVAFDGQLIADEDMTYLTIKDILDGYIAFDNKDFGEKFKNSFLAQEDAFKGLDELPIKDLDYFSETGFLQRNNGFYSGISEKFWEASEVKTSGSETLDLGGKSVKCKTYKVTIKKDDAKRILDESIEEYMEEILSDENASDYLNSAGVSDPEELKAQIKALFDTMITEDIIYKAYVKGGHVVGYTAEGSLNLMGTPVKYDLMIKNTGDKNVTASGETSLVITIQGVAINMYAKYGSTADGNTINSYFNGKISLAGTAITMDIDQKFDTSTGKLDISGNMTSSGQELMTISGNGNITDIVKGKSFTYSLDHLTLTSNGRQAFDMNVKCKVSTEANVESLDSSKRVINVFQVSKSEFDQFIKDNEKNFERLDENLKPIKDKLDGKDDD